jgi:hypothetical protein
MHWIDPDCLTPIKSKVERFLFNPRGQADGMILASGLEAHFPPHLSDKVMTRFRPGDAVTLYGVKPRAVDMIACVALENSRGERIDDMGPPRKAKKKGKQHDDSHKAVESEPTEIEGIVERVLHGPKGEARGVLLESGDIVRFPPYVADDNPKLLAPGRKLAVSGHALQVKRTTVIEATGLGRSQRTVKRLSSKPPEHG